MNSKQGKSKALNLALFNCQGKYIIHIDSDGMLEPDAIRNIVTMFENEQEVHSLTGTVLTNPELIDPLYGYCRRWSLVNIVRHFYPAVISSRS